MDRKDFLKSMFGAAVVATMPQVVVRQIENIPLSEEVKPQPEVIKPTPVKSISKPITSENVLFIYDNEKLIGYSTEFDVTTEVKTMNFYVDSLIGYYTQVPIPPKYTLSANHIHWVVNPKDLFASKQTLDCLIRHDKLTIKAQMYISSLQVSFGMFEQGEYSSEFEITGAVQIEIE
jgi:hypothetical protein